jgi:hypothetical protein
VSRRWRPQNDRQFSAAFYSRPPGLDFDVIPETDLISIERHLNAPLCVGSSGSKSERHGHLPAATAPKGGGVFFPGAGSKNNLFMTLS